jgi:hypothetical protein
MDGEGRSTGSLSKAFSSKLRSSGSGTARTSDLGVFDAGSLTVLGFFLRRGMELSQEPWKSLKAWDEEWTS